MCDTQLAISRRVSPISLVLLRVSSLQIGVFPWHYSFSAKTRLTVKHKVTTLTLINK